MLEGVVQVSGRQWNVREERRQGPRNQIFILVATDESGAEMHVRPPPTAAVTSLEEVQLLAVDPAIRWVVDGDGIRWEARMVGRPEPLGPDSLLVKFIGSTGEVYEGPYGHHQGLGVHPDDELLGLLNTVRGQQE